MRRAAIAERRPVYNEQKPPCISRGRLFMLRISNAQHELAGGYPFRNDSRSALTCSTCVLHMPCGAAA
jgi:hypothetical protein